MCITQGGSINMRNKHFFKIYAKVNKGESILRGMDAWCRFWINTSEILNGLFTCSRDSRDGYHSCERTKCFVNDGVVQRGKKLTMGEQLEPFRETKKLFFNERKKRTI